MTKPYPTTEEVQARIDADPRALWWKVEAELIKIICDLDRERREAPAEDRIDWAAYPDVKLAVATIGGLVFGIADSLTAPVIRDQHWNKLPKQGRWVPMPNATIPGPWQDSLRARPEGV